MCYTCALSCVNHAHYTCATHVYFHVLHMCCTFNALALSLQCQIEHTAVVILTDNHFFLAKSNILN